MTPTHSTRALDERSGATASAPDVWARIPTGVTVEEAMADVTSEHWQDMLQRLRGCFPSAVDQSILEDAINTAAERLLRTRRDRAVDNLQAFWLHAAKNCVRDILKGPAFARSITPEAYAEQRRALAAHGSRSQQAFVAGNRAVARPSIDTPLSRLMASEFRHEVEKLLDTLSTDVRYVFVRHDVQGYSYDEICAELGASYNTVKMRLFRARSHLRRWLDDYSTDILTTETGVW